MTVPRNIRMGDFVAATALLFGLTPRDVLIGARLCDLRSRAALVWTIRFARGAKFDPIADAIGLSSGDSARMTALRATRLRESDIVFRARTDLMFAVFMKTPREG